MEYRKIDLRKIRYRLRAVWLAVGMTLSCAACTAPLPWGDGFEPSVTPERVDTGFVVTGPDSYDSADTAVLVGKNEKENTLTFLNLVNSKKYTLSMDGTTRLYDRYGAGLSSDQVSLGDIVDVTFLKSKKHLTTLRLSQKAWSNTNVERHEFNMVRGEVSIGSGTYKLTSNTQYYSEGENIEIMDISPMDILSFQGIDTQVLTVKVEKGHGYLRLVNDEKFVDGWIEIGQKQIEKITQDMLLVVPEGSYQVSVSNKGGGGAKNVVISRNEETVLDVGEFEIPEPQKGMVLFSLSPSETELYIDGVKTDASSPVSLEYGLHQLIARAEGYQSVTRYIRVSQESAGINVVLDQVRQPEEEPKSTPAPETTTSYYKIHIDAPEGVEVYLDGNYVGVTPCSFRKTAGTHVIILRKAGYETRSYTIQVDDEEKDLSYSFIDLATVSGGE